MSAPFGVSLSAPVAPHHLRGENTASPFIVPGRQDRVGGGRTGRSGPSAACLPDPPPPACLGV